MPTEQEIRERINDLSEKWYDIITELCAKAYVNGFSEGSKNGQEDNDQEGLDRIAEKSQSD